MNKVKRAVSLCLFVLFVCSFASSVQAKKVLPMKQVIQEQTQWCWAGISRSILLFMGKDFKQCAIAEFARSVATWHNFGKVNCCTDPKKGCNYWNYLYGNKSSIKDVLAHFGKIQSQARGSALTVAELRTEIETNARPFVVRWGWKSGGGHFVIAHGVDGQTNNPKVHYMNPWFGEGLKIGTFDWLKADNRHTWTHSLFKLKACACTGKSACCDGCGAINNGNSCNDNSVCTQGDVCNNGWCEGKPKVICKAKSPCHEPGICNPKTGICSERVKKDGELCNAGDLCRPEDRCSSGVCKPGKMVQCKIKDQCHTIGLCNPKTGLCSAPTKKDGTTCNDGNLCSQQDQCLSGVCQSGKLLECKAKDTCHEPGICNPKTGLCSEPVKKDGATCDDRNLCTRQDTCQKGVCTGDQPTTCTAENQCHIAGLCDPLTGVCSAPAAKDGLSCDDGNLCTIGDQCKQATCTGKTLVCQAKDECHKPGTCDPTTGSCSNPLKQAGALCNDGKGRCLKGVCTKYKEQETHDEPNADAGITQDNKPAPSSGCGCDSQAFPKEQLVLWMVSLFLFLGAIRSIRNH